MTWSPSPIEVSSAGTMVRVIIDCRSPEMAMRLRRKLDVVIHGMLQQLLAEEFDTIVRDSYE